MSAYEDVTGGMATKAFRKQEGSVRAMTSIGDNTLLKNNSTSLRLNLLKTVDRGTRTTAKGMKPKLQIKSKTANVATKRTFTVKEDLFERSK